MNDSLPNILNQWGQAVEAQDQATVLDLYHPSATLLPTLQYKICQGPDIKAYFDSFLPKVVGPVSWDEFEVHELPAGQVLVAGHYTFQLTSGEAVARFSYLLDSKHIYHHHSSVRPS